MSTLYVLKNQAMYDLMAKVSSLEEKEVIALYQKKESFNFSNNELLDSQIEIDIDKLNSKLDPNSDSKSSIAIYSSFINLNPIDASDKRLWITLSHRDFWNYVQLRWPLKETPKSIVDSRWLFNGSDRTAFTRNSISRLWWAGHLTFSPWDQLESLNVFKSEDPYKYTKIMTNTSQLWFDVTEREWGSNLVFRICFLEAFDRILSEQQITNRTSLSRKLSIILTASLVPDIVLASQKDPLSLLEYILSQLPKLNIKT